jgi:phage shock protein PspC (stress-responsive transcriptional regulator)
MAGLHVARPPEAVQANQLRRDKRNKRIGGVCAGFARYFGVDIVLMRVLWLVIAFATGVGFLVYLAAWVAIPSDGGYPGGYEAAYEPPPAQPYFGEMQEPPQRR